MPGQTDAGKPRAAAGTRRVYLPGSIFRRIASRNSAIILLMFIITLILLAYPDPSDERNLVPLDGSYSYDENTPTPTGIAAVSKKDPLLFKKIQLQIDEEPQVMYLLELDLSNPDVKVFPVLSQDRIFGFEKLSVMHDRYIAKASVNAGFNFSYGQPAGLVIQNGRLLSGSMGYGRTLLLQDQKAWFQDAPVKVWIERDGEQLPVDRVNPYPSVEGILIFTPEYGPTNRVDVQSTVCVVKNNCVASVTVEDGEVNIPDDGFLIVDLRVEDSPLLHYSVGQEIVFRWEKEADQGYQCSGSLVKNGQNVAGDNDPWGGNMRIHTPRTAVGIKDENTLVFLVADGRQPGYSKGLTGKQLAEVLISLGVTEAALLDGGASSEMIFDSEIVNKPSTGKERLLASGFIICVNEDGTF